MHPISNPQTSPENTHFPTTNIPLDPIPVVVPFIFLVLGLPCVAPLPLAVVSPFIVGDPLPFPLTGELLTKSFSSGEEEFEKSSLNFNKITNWACKLPVAYSRSNLDLSLVSTMPFNTSQTWRHLSEFCMTRITMNCKTW